MTLVMCFIALLISRASCFSTLLFFPYLTLGFPFTETGLLGGTASVLTTAGFAAVFPYYLDPFLLLLLERFAGPYYWY